jgi:hypothetical protein
MHTTPRKGEGGGGEGGGEVDVLVHAIRKTDSKRVRGSMDENGVRKTVFGSLNTLY